MFEKLITAVLILASFVLIIFLNVSSPSTGPGAILIVFFLLYIVFFCGFTWLIRGGSLVVKQISKSFQLRTPLESITMKNSAYYASFVAITPVMVIAMSSVGKISIYEFLLLTAFLIIGVFYIRKRVS